VWGVNEESFEVKGSTDDRNTCQVYAVAAEDRPRYIPHDRQLHFSIQPWVVEALCIDCWSGARSKLV
jgi:hypothetical protein